MISCLQNCNREGSSHVGHIISQLLREAVTEPFCLSIPGIPCCNIMEKKVGDVLKIAEKIRNRKGYQSS